MLILLRESKGKLIWRLLQDFTKDGWLSVQRSDSTNEVLFKHLDENIQRYKKT